MEMGNMSKRQQLDQIADNCRRLPMDLQRSEKIPQLEVVLSWPLNKIVLVQENEHHTKLSMYAVIL